MAMAINTTSVFNTTTTTLSSSYPDLQFPEEWMNDTIRTLNMSVNIVSIISACLVELIIFAIWVYDHKLVDRVSLRLSAAISLTDIINAASLLTYSAYDVDCQVSTFFIVWLTNQYLFLSCAIAFNLQYLFLQKRPFNPRMEKWYYIVSTALAFVSAFIPLVFRRFGYDDAQGYCWYTPSYTRTSQIWEYTTFIVPITLSIIYTTLISLLVSFRLKRDSAVLERTISAPRTNMWEPAHLPHTRIARKINRAVRRILLYCLIPLVTQAGFVVSEIYMYNTLKISFPLNLWSVIGGAMPGLCNFLAFTIDPAVTNAFESIHKTLVARYAPQNDTNSDQVKPYLPQLVPAANPPNFLVRFLVRMLLDTKPRQNSSFQMMSDDVKERNVTLSQEAFPDRSILDEEFIGMENGRPSGERAARKVLQGL